MKFDEFKPGMFLVSTVRPTSWALVKAQRGGTVTIDDYWTGRFGHFYKAYNKNVKQYAWPANNLLAGRPADTTYRLGTIRDAQELIVTIFRSED